MTYKNKVIFLVCVIALLAIAYTASHVFDIERVNARSAMFSWLDAKAASLVSGIVIEDFSRKVELIKRDGAWFALVSGNIYPARQKRVDDFIAIFAEKAAWPVRSSSAESRERLGLNRETASRITFYGENDVLLDVLSARNEAPGRETFLRKYDGVEARSGGGDLSQYIDGSVNYWLNLALIPESVNGQPRFDSAQRLSVFHDGKSRIISRENGEWIVSGADAENQDQYSAENYVRTILSLEGDSFADPASANNMAFNDSRIVIEFGNGDVVTIRFGAENETGGCLARVGNGDYVYSISAWVRARIFDSF